MTNTQASTLDATPAGRLIKRFGARHLAHWTGRHISRVYSWSWPPARNGTGGVVPHRVRSLITSGAAQELGVHLEPQEFELADGERYHFGTAA